MKIIILLLCNLALGEYRSMFLQSLYIDFLIIAAFSCTGFCNLSYQQNDEVNDKVFNVSTNTEFKVVNTTEQTLDEERENDRKLMEQWTRMFFSMGRVPQQGAQVLIFPGLFSKLAILSISQLWTT